MAARPVQCGIYEITNTLDGKKYYGSTVNYRTRLSHHKGALKRKVHPNRHLQNAWNRDGESVFEFQFVAEIAPAHLRTVEQYFLDVNSNGYNIAKDARAAGRGRTQSSITRARISAAQKGRKKSARHTRRSWESKGGRGYYYDKGEHKWRVKICRRSYGYYATEEEAARVAAIVKARVLADYIARENAE